MHHERPDEYHVGPSRAPRILIALLSGAGCAWSAYELITKQNVVPGTVHPLVLLVFFGAYAAYMGRDALWPPKTLSLDSQAAAFAHPPVRILWEDVTDVEVFAPGVIVTVEVSVVDLDKYLAPLTAAQRKALRYDATSRTMRFFFFTNGRVPELRSEIAARLQGGKGG